jgi:predicted house-cleaning noncanonical NTP pyrophosphatase (MazG superfamily)
MAKWSTHEEGNRMIAEDDLEAFGYWSHETTENHKTPTEMVKEYAKTTGQKPNHNLYAELIIEEFEEWCIEFNPELELKELADLLYVIYGYANARGWDVEEALRRVHKNNMGRMYQPDGTIKRREDGKIIKNADYPKVELSDLV